MNAPQPSEIDIHDTSLRGLEREGCEVKLQVDEVSTERAEQT